MKLPHQINNFGSTIIITFFLGSLCFFISVKAIFAILSSPSLTYIFGLVLFTLLTIIIFKSILTGYIKTTLESDKISFKRPLLFFEFSGFKKSFNINLDQIKKVTKTNSGGRFKSTIYLFHDKNSNIIFSYESGGDSIKQDWLKEYFQTKGIKLIHSKPDERDFKKLITKSTIK